MTEPEEPTFAPADDVFTALESIPRVDVDLPERQAATRLWQAGLDYEITWDRTSAAYVASPERWPQLAAAGGSPSVALRGLEVQLVGILVEDPERRVDEVLAEAAGYIQLAADGEFSNRPRRPRR